LITAFAGQLFGALKHFVDVGIKIKLSCPSALNLGQFIKGFCHKAGKGGNICLHEAKQAADGALGVLKKGCQQMFWCKALVGVSCGQRLGVLQDFLRFVGIARQIHFFPSKVEQALLLWYTKRDFKEAISFDKDRPRKETHDG
jgi:hypothetical protein